MKYRSSILFLFFAIAIVFPDNCDAQKGLIARGDRKFQKFDFLQAAEIYKKAVEKYPESAQANAKLADCYRLMNDLEQAELYYALVVEEPGADPMSQLYFAQSLRSNGKYDVAKEFFETYSELNPADQSGKKIAETMELVKLMAEPNPLYQVELLSFNTAASEFSPAFYGDGIVFASNRAKEFFIKRLDLRTQNKFLQLFKVDKDESGKFKNPQFFEGKSVNGKYHEGPVAFNRNESEALLTRSNYTSGREVKGVDKTVHLKLFTISYSSTDDQWGGIKEAVPFNSNNYSVGHPTVSQDGQWLYFMSDMPGGYGSTDIYVSKLTAGVWGTPVNLGPEVNTSGHEMFPFIGADNMLYFASSGHPGLGGLDMYTSELIDNRWTRVANMGAPINSNKDDFGIIVDETGKAGYFTSNRDGGFGDDDIYAFSKQGVLITGVVFDPRTDEPVSNAFVELEDGRSVLTDTEGGFKFNMEPNNKYIVSASKEEYLPEEMSVNVSNTPAFIKIPIQKDLGIVLEVVVQDKVSKEKLRDALVVLKNSATGQVVECKTNGEGLCVFPLEENASYQITGSKDLPDPNKNYLTISTSFSSAGRKSGSTIFAVIDLEMVEKGVAIKIDNIYYDLNKWFIRPDAAIELDKIVKIMTDNPTMRIELSSHTDSRGSDKYNKDLSAKRAQSAVEYILGNGIADNRIVSAGYGEERLVNNCSNGVQCSEELHQDNRRTEFKILQF
ncbi:MAG: OmpA family protein [Chitinophagales bacterium]|nr:OmpA family protein [Chitinophagales bacterium]